MKEKYQMTISKAIGTNEVVLTLGGRLDTATSPELEEELKPLWEAGDTDITLNLAELSYVSSAGLRVLLMSEKKCKANKKQFTIKGANESIREIFDLTGFSGILTVVS